MVKKLEPGIFHGTTERCYDFGGLTLAETVFPAGLDIPPHEHANAFLALLLEGYSTQSCAGRTWTSRPFSLTSFPAGLAHANRWHDSGGRVLHIEFASSWRERLGGRSTVLDRPASYEHGPQVWLARRLFEECRRQDDVSPLAVEGLVLVLLAECARSRVELPQAQPPRWLGRVHELLHDRFAENLSLADVAAAAGVSDAHLARSFLRHHGCTVGEYVRRLRVAFACRRLATSELPLVEVALDAGFTDQSHFTKTFKRLTGVTPAVFRHQHGQRRSRTKD
jgi:AraC-like DNA-binding protein